jgi:hypothetical protein
MLDPSLLGGGENELSSYLIGENGTLTRLLPSS